MLRNTYSNEHTLAAHLIFWKFSRASLRNSNCNTIQMTSMFRDKSSQRSHACLNSSISFSFSHVVGVLAVYSCFEFHSSSSISSSLFWRCTKMAARKLKLREYSKLLAQQCIALLPCTKRSFFNSYHPRRDQHPSEPNHTQPQAMHEKACTLSPYLSWINWEDREKTLRYASLKAAKTTVLDDRQMRLRQKRSNLLLQRCARV